MKNIYRYRHLFLALFIISLGTFISSFFIDDFIEIIKNICVFIMGVSIVLFYYLYVANKTLKNLQVLEEKMSLWNNISYRVKKAGEYTFNNLPVGIIVYSNNLVVEWANTYARDIFLSPLNDRDLNVINEELCSKISESNLFNITIYGSTYEVQVLKQYNILYFINKTDYESLKKRFEDKTLAVGILNIDNLDQALASYDAQEKSLQMSNLIGILGEWSNKHQIYLKGFSEEKYLLLMNHSQLMSITQEKFKIMDEIKNYCSKEGLRITISIGLACKDDNILNIIDLAEQQLEMALNRGGDQCVCLIDDNIEYYGARAQNFEQRSATYVRVKVEELADLIRASSNVIVMGHLEMDADSYASCFVISRIAESLGRDAKIVFDKEYADKTVVNVYESIQKEHVNLLNMMLNSHQALQKITNDTLLVIVDCQYTNLLLDQKIYSKCNNVAIIDHHRRNRYAINDYRYLYIQPSASSTVELLTEMLEYLDRDKLAFSEMEATLMLMGIIVDTNNFMYRTSSRTFNTLAVIQSLDADMNKVRRFLREDFNEFVKKMNNLNNLELVEPGFGIVVCDETQIYQKQFLAKLADSMISVNDIRAAFCIGYIGNNVVGISARSLDECNVQVIMEQLQGGGHFNNAATQLDNITLKEAREMLLNKLKQLDDGGTVNMRVILTKDVKGKGKINDIIEVPAGHGNFLIRSNQAIEATTDNVKQLELMREKEKNDAEKFLENMQSLKTIIETKPVTVKVKVGKEGKIFGSVSSKQIVEEYKAQNGIDLDKRKMIYDKNIDSLGTYYIPISLHKEVTAKITLYVVELK